MFGSPVLQGGWKDVDATHSAYHCATTWPIDPLCTGMGGAADNVPPHDAAGKLIVDDQGRPLLAAYEGAFGQNQTAFTLSCGGKSCGTEITIKQTYPNIQSAMVGVLLHTNPYDVSSSPPMGEPRELQVLVPWLPKQPGVGFPVALTGT